MTCIRKGKELNCKCIPLLVMLLPGLYQVIYSKKAEHGGLSCALYRLYTFVLSTGGGTQLFSWSHYFNHHNFAIITNGTHVTTFQTNSNSIERGMYLKKQHMYM